MALVLRLLNWLIQRLTEEYKKLDDSAAPDARPQKRDRKPDQK